MKDLKAIVSEKEEQSKEKQLLREGGGLRHLRGGASAGNLSGKNSFKDDIFNSKKSNSGIEKRNEKDLLEMELEKKSKNNKSNLEKKVALYDKMKNGEIGAVEAERAGFLVDFQNSDKIKHQDQGTHSSSQSQPITDAIEEEDDENVEIEDEFGRTFVVSRYSQKYQEYKQRLQLEQSESVRRQLEEERQHKIHRNAGGSYQQQYNGDDAGGDINQYGHKRPRQEPQHQWPVSTGRNREDCGEWNETLTAQEGQGMVDFNPVSSDLKSSSSSFHRSSRHDNRDKEEDRDDSDGPLSVVNGRVKSKWEFTLSVEEKNHLKDIAQETAINRAMKAAATQPSSNSASVVVEDSGGAGAGAGGGDSGNSLSRRDPKAERRELLRKKKEARLSAK
jgi:hypothetical protein